MKRIILLFFGFYFVTNVTFSQFKLDIEITGIRNNTGNIKLEVYDSVQKVISQDTISIKDLQCTYTFQSMKAGHYGIRYFHDENLNGKMETNKFGKPLEGYGFSNNVTGKFGPPQFDKWLFEITSDKKISLKPTY